MKSLIVFLAAAAAIGAVVVGQFDRLDQTRRAVLSGEEARQHAVARVGANGQRASAAQLGKERPLGTDLELDLSGRSGIADDGNLTARGAFGLTAPSTFNRGAEA